MILNAHAHHHGWQSVVDFVCRFLEKNSFVQKPIIIKISIQNQFYYLLHSIDYKLLLVNLARIYIFILYPDHKPAHLLCLRSTFLILSILLLTLNCNAFPAILLMVTCAASNSSLFNILFVSYKNRVNAPDHCARRSPSIISFFSISRLILAPTLSRPEKAFFFLSTTFFSSFSSSSSLSSDRHFLLLINYTAPSTLIPNTAHLFFLFFFFLFCELPMNCSGPSFSFQK